MRFQQMWIPEVVKITTKRHVDARGYFSEHFREDEFLQNVGPFQFVQENVSLSLNSRTLRGLHFQTSPYAQGKLVTCLTGAIFDVAVDMRIGSPTYGKYVSVELTPEDGSWLWIPEGFAHGFMTLKPDTMVLYKVTNYYSAKSDRGVIWNDAEIGIDWPFLGEPLIMSEKDQDQPSLAEAFSTLS